jgi:hypothetical protein
MGLCHLIILGGGISENTQAEHAKDLESTLERDNRGTGKISQDDDDSDGQIIIYLIHCAS